MSKTYFTSDLHFGHEQILKFSGEHGRQGSNSKEHDQWLIDSWNSVVKPHDVVWVLGDVAMGRPGTTDVPGKGWKNLAQVGRLVGNKKVIIGNHDDMPIDAYMQYFHVIRGVCKFKGQWLSHTPIHPAELRGRKNIHGHVHHKSITIVDKQHNIVEDDRYINVCVEANIRRNGTIMVEWDELNIDVQETWKNSKRNDDDRH